MVAPMRRSTVRTPMGQASEISDQCANGGHGSDQKIVKFR